MSGILQGQLGMLCPTFDGSNEREFRENVTKLISGLRVFGGAVSDDQYIKTLLKDWKKAELAAGRAITVESFLTFIELTWKDNNPTVTTQTLLQLSRKYLNLPITDPMWEGMVSSFKALRDKMILGIIDTDLVNWIFGPMTPTMRQGVISNIASERLSTAQQAESVRLLKYAEDRFNALAANSTSLPLAGSPALPDRGPFTLKELDVAIRSYVTTNRPLARFTEGISAGPANPMMSATDQAAIDALIRGHSQTGFGGTVPTGSVPFSFESSPVTSHQAPPSTPAQPATSGKNRRDSVGMDEFTKLFGDLRMEFQDDIRSLRQQQPPKQSYVKARSPPASTESGVTSTPFEVNGLAAPTASVRCFYCGLPGHYKDQCSLLEQDMLSGAKVMIGKDRKLRWINIDSLGVRSLGEEVKGHKEGARRNVVFVDGDAAYMEALSQVDTSILIESYSFGFDEVTSPPPLKMLRFRVPPHGRQAVQQFPEKLLSEARLVDVEPPQPTLPASVVTKEEALR
ncbi:hypothetical protein HDU67_003748, partial [Dinochytrium kinnereticum]